MYEDDDIKDFNKKLDMNWIINFENIDKRYKEYYKTDLSKINIHYIYINTSLEIVKVKKDIFLLKTLNCITKEDIIHILKKNSMLYNIRYKLQTILQYNIDIDPQNLSKINTNSDNFFNIIKNIDNIYWKKTIKLFENLNDLFLIFYENNIHNTSKKIYLINKNKDRIIRHNKSIKNVFKDNGV